MKVTCRPDVRLSANNEVSGGVTGYMDHGDMRLSMRVSDETFGDGANLKGMTLRARKDNCFSFDYDVGDNAPSMVLFTNASIQDKDVRIKLRHSVKPKSTTSLEAGFDVNDDNRATLCYDLTGYDKPDLNRVTAKWRYTKDDWSIEPGYNFGSESAFVEGRYKLDDENKMRATYDLHNNEAMLQWVNSGSMGGGGDLRVTATMCMDEGAKKMPCLRAEKTWDVDW